MLSDLPLKAPLLEASIMPGPPPEITENPNSENLNEILSAS